MNKQAKAGFTLIEILVALSLMVVIAGFIMIGFQNFTRYQNFDYAVGTVRTALQQSHENAVRAVDGTAHGVKVGTSTITLFNGGTYDAADTTNRVVSMQGVILSHSLTGGTDEVIFASLTGLPNATGTIDISGTTFSASSTITIDNVGGIQ